MSAQGLTLLALLFAAGAVGAADEASGETETAENPEPPPELKRVPRKGRHCLRKAAATAPDGTTAKTLRQWCDTSANRQGPPSHDALRARLALEEHSQLNPFVLTPHQRNYLMPWSYWNNRSWKDPARDADTLQPNEVKFQISLKTPIVDEALGAYTLYGAFTMTAWWQAYNEKLSHPFRETNYAPSIFITRPVDWQFGPIDSELLSGGLIHESNGQALPTSRGWNRLFANYVFRTGPYYVQFKPWWRIPEDEQDYPGDPDGDTNPNITDYMGNFELTISRPFSNHVVEFMFRHNLDLAEDRGAAQLDYSFPINERFKGIFQVFTGYGDSLIHYNEYITRVSIGILLTDTL